MYKIYHDDDEILRKGPTRQLKHAVVDEAAKTGHFTHQQRGSHAHKWIFGDISAVCTKCGLTLPKGTPLPERGTEIPPT